MPRIATDMKKAPKKGSKGNQRTVKGGRSKAGRIAKPKGYGY
jgi:hypothetical protein